MRRALMNFVDRDGWTFHIIGEDCRTLLVGYRKVKDEETLLRFIARLNGDVAEAKSKIDHCSRRSVRIDLSPAQCRYFGIPWKDGTERIIRLDDEQLFCERGNDLALFFLSESREAAKQVGIAEPDDLLSRMYNSLRDLIEHNAGCLDCNEQ